MNKFFKLIASLSIPQFAGIIGSFFTVSAISDWYVHLEKPLLTPPNWLFGPAWITLYFLIGFSLFLVWSSENKKAMLVFFFQLFLNASWSILFFGLRSPLLGFINIILLLIAILLNIVVFYKISKTSAFLLVPYFLWTIFAAYLNFSILILN